MVKIRRSVKEASRENRKDVVNVNLELTRADYVKITNSNTRVRGTLAAIDEENFEFTPWATTKNVGNQNKQNKTQYAKTTVYKNGDVRFAVKVPKKKLEDFEDIIDDEVDSAVDFIEEQTD